MTQLIAEQTHATVAVVSPAMDILTAAAPGESAERAAGERRGRARTGRPGEVLAAASVDRLRRAL